MEKNISQEEVSAGISASLASGIKQLKIAESKRKVGYYVSVLLTASLFLVTFSIGIFVYKFPYTQYVEGSMHAATAPEDLHTLSTNLFNKTFSNFFDFSVLKYHLCAYNAKLYELRSKSIHRNDDSFSFGKSCAFFGSKVAIFFVGFFTDIYRSLSILSFAFSITYNSTNHVTSFIPKYIQTVKGLSDFYFYKNPTVFSTYIQDMNNQVKANHCVVLINHIALSNLVNLRIPNFDNVLEITKTLNSNSTQHLPIVNFLVYGGFKTALPVIYEQNNHNAYFADVLNYIVKQSLAVESFDLIDKDIRFKVIKIAGSSFSVVNVRDTMLPFKPLSWNFVPYQLQFHFIFDYFLIPALWLVPLYVGGTIYSFFVVMIQLIIAVFSVSIISINSTILEPILPQFITTSLEILFSGAAFFSALNFSNWLQLAFAGPSKMANLLILCSTPWIYVRLWISRLWNRRTLSSAATSAEWLGKHPMFSATNFYQSQHFHMLSVAVAEQMSMMSKNKVINYSLLSQLDKRNKIQAAYDGVRVSCGAFRQLSAIYFSKPGITVDQNLVKLGFFSSVTAILSDCYANTLDKIGMNNLRFIQEKIETFSISGQDAIALTKSGWQDMQRTVQQTQDEGKLSFISRSINNLAVEKIVSPFIKTVTLLDYLQTINVKWYYDYKLYLMPKRDVSLDSHLQGDQKMELEMYKYIVNMNNVFVKFALSVIDKHTVKNIDIHANNIVVNVDVNNELYKTKQALSVLITDLENITFDRRILTTADVFNNLAIHVAKEISNLPESKLDSNYVLSDSMIKLSIIKDLAVGCLRTVYVSTPEGFNSSMIDRTFTLAHQLNHKQLNFKPEEYGNPHFTHKLWMSLTSILNLKQPLCVEIPVRDIVYVNMMGTVIHNMNAADIANKLPKNSHRYCRDLQILDYMSKFQNLNGISNSIFIPDNPNAAHFMVKGFSKLNMLFSSSHIQKMSIFGMDKNLKLSSDFSNANWFVFKTFSVPDKELLSMAFRGMSVNYQNTNIPQELKDSNIFKSNKVYFTMFSAGLILCVAFDMSR